MSKYTRDTDSAKNDYIEVEVPSKDESVRVTYVEKGYDGGPCVRIQIHEHGKQLRMGPEFPVENASQVVAGLIELLTN